jgi:hypothetical protein
MHSTIYRSLANARAASRQLFERPRTPLPVLCGSDTNGDDARLLRLNASMDPTHGPLMALLLSCVIVCCCLAMCVWCVRVLGLFAHWFLSCRRLGLGRRAAAASGHAAHGRRAARERMGELIAYKYRTVRCSLCCRVAHC